MFLTRLTFPKYVNQLLYNLNLYIENGHLSRVERAATSESHTEESQPYDYQKEKVNQENGTRTFLHLWYQIQR